MFHSLQRPFLYSAYRLFAQFAGNGDAKTTTGTAFFVTNGSDQIGLVTNRHAIDISYKGPKYARYTLNGLAIRGYFVGGSFAHAAINLADSKLEVASNYFEDVATLRIGQVQVASGGSGPLTPHAVNRTMLATAQDFENGFEICDMLAFPGYPTWFDRNGERPIIRCGTIASDPTSNYSWKDGQASARRLAYEAFSFGGSSGSPVYALEKGLKLGSGLTGAYHRDVKLIGLNAGHLSDSDDFPSHHSGISYLFKSTVVLECLDALFPQAFSVAAN